MKYATMDWGTMEAVVNKLGGMDGVQKFLRGDLEVREQPKEVVSASGIITIDRTTPFDPAKFKGLGKGWTIWKGPASGDGLEGEEDQDSRSLAIAELDLSKIRLEHMLTEDELKSDSPYVNGEVKQGRLKDHIRLDAKILQTFWENKHLIPEVWKKKTNGNITCVFFDGTILRSPDGNRDVLCLYWDYGEWHWNYNWLDNDFNANNPSAVLATLFVFPSFSPGLGWVFC